MHQLDIKTYFLAPSFINTYQKHIGKRYRIIETNLTTEQDQIDEFIREKIINPIKLPKIRSQLTEWYARAKSDYNRSRFFLNGLRTLFDDNLDWLAHKLDSINDKLYEVIEWPEIKTTMVKIDSARIQSAEFFLDFIKMDHLESSLKSIVTAPFNKSINISVRDFCQNVLPSFMGLLGLLNEMKTNTTDWSEQPDWSLYDREIVGDEKIVREDKPRLFNDSIAYKAKYFIRKANLRSDNVCKHVDKFIVELNDAPDKYKVRNNFNLI